MVFKAFRFRIVGFITASLVFGFTAVYFLTQTDFWLLSFWFTLFMVITLYNLIRYVERSYDELGNFLMAIRQNDFSGSFPPKKGRPDNTLHYAFNLINSEFQRIRTEKESNYHFLKAIVEQTGVALLCYNETTQEVILMNESAKMLFNKPHLKSIQALRKIDVRMVETVEKLESGQKELLKIAIRNEILHLSILAKEIKLQNELYKIISFQDIRSELDEKELESWQKLIRVLTHEIKNSAIPIATLSEVINQMIRDEQGSPVDIRDLSKESEEDLKIGLHTIEKRSKGLVNFVNSYGQLAKIPKPKIEKVKVNDLLKEVYHFISPEMQKAKISFTIKEGPASASVDLDPELISQVLINLLKNAKEALLGQEVGKVALKAQVSNKETLLIVEDNGPGIGREQMEQIFIPFYTTKKQGSGIGLSLSRQIMKVHKGNIIVYSQVGEGTKFSLVF